MVPAKQDHSSVKNKAPYLERFGPWTLTHDGKALAWPRADQDFSELAPYQGFRYELLITPKTNKIRRNLYGVDGGAKGSF